MQPHVISSPSNKQTIEEWRAVAGYEGLYEVSNLGRVRSLDRDDSAGRRRKGRILRPALSTGYPYVNLSKNARQRPAKVHHLVARAFLGVRPKGHTVNHIDADRTNNHVSNLEYLTTKDNIRHAACLGLMGKLNCEQVWEIREAYAGENPPSFEFFAEKFGVGRATIRDTLSLRTNSYILNRDGSVPAPVFIHRGLAGVDVCALRDAGQSLSVIARQYGVNPSTVSKAHKAQLARQAREDYG